ncbi:MAG: hypothetical protein GX653_06245 [Clostridiales bacterium]|nr:hypothetical protein [Clostridiales bacterium]
MTQQQFAGFWRLLRHFSEAGLLPHMLVIGSWAEYLYAQSGFLPGFVANLRTLDVDFLIRNQRRPAQKVNLMQAVQASGCLMEQDTLTGATKLYTLDGLEVEFLIAQKGSGQEAVLPTNLGVNAQALTHISMLRDHAVEVTVFDMRIMVPLPEAYVLHKCVINERRGLKAEKDRQAINGLAPYLDATRLSDIFETLQRKEKAAALAALQRLGIDTELKL